MLSILSGLLGIGSSALPSVLGFFQQKGDQKHEIAMAKLQSEREMAMAAAGLQSQEKIAAIEYESTLAETYAQEREALYAHDMKLMDKASQSTVDLNAKVRPIIAFTFVGLLVATDMIGLGWAIYSGVDFLVAMNNVFSDDEMAIVSSIIGFYFGSRQWEKMREGK
jgi:hypothetical protein